MPHLCQKQFNKHHCWISAHGANFRVYSITESDVEHANDPSSIIDRDEASDEDIDIEISAAVE
jgi:hypothetical protein